jgi:hypothetical protein
MDLNDENTWPDDLLAHLERERSLFLDWESGNSGTVSGPQYDAASERLRAVLKRYTLHGYHCTRLATSEIGNILARGMQPPNSAMLRGRIQALQDK